MGLREDTAAFQKNSQSTPQTQNTHDPHLLAGKTDIMLDRRKAQTGKHQIWYIREEQS